MYFLKYKHRFSYGEDYWDYIEILDDNEETIEEVVEKIEEKFDYSEQYRGIKYEIVEKPPDEWLIDKINDYYNKISYYKVKINEYHNLLKGE